MCRQARRFALIPFVPTREAFHVEEVTGMLSQRLLVGMALGTCLTLISCSSEKAAEAAETETPCAQDTCTESITPPSTHRSEYRSDSDEAALLTEAVGLVNAFDLKDQGLRLHLCFDELPGAIDGVPVYLVRSKPATAGQICFVPVNEKCVLFQADELELMKKRFTPEDGRGLDLDMPALVAFFLLHEVGHIHAEHYKRGKSASISTSELNNTTTEAKGRELKADEYAASVIVAANTESAFDNAARFNAWFRLTMMITACDWNLWTIRMLDNPGTTILRDPRVLWDRGYSHPNLELRFIIISHLMNPTDESKKQLEEFEAFRNEVPKVPEPVYIRAQE
jgi:hypothetical protein